MTARGKVIKQGFDELVEEWMEARASGKPMKNGYYPHLVICSADHRKPVGKLGCVCDRRYSKLRCKYALALQCIRWLERHA